MSNTNIQDHKINGSTSAVNTGNNTSQDSQASTGPVHKFPRAKRRFPTPQSQPDYAQMHARYDQKLAEVKRKAEQGDLNAQAALEICQKLDEPNVLAVYRLIYLFGCAKIKEYASESHKLYIEAQAQGKSAYAPSAEGTLVASRAGYPRSLGGVFFAVVRQAANNLGINYDALYLPQPPLSANPEKNSNRGSVVRGSNNPRIEGMPKVSHSNSNNNNNAGSAGAATINTKEVRAAAPPSHQPPAAVVKGATPPASSVVPTGVTTTDVPVVGIKPGKAKLTVTGPLYGLPKREPQGRAGLVELVIKTEINPHTLPKGLPSLGGTKVVVWYTEKQFGKIEKSLNPQSRLLLEGEVAGAVSKDFQPFLRVVCTRLTTVEIEQVRRAKELEAPAAENS